jgi:Mn2+/Fe2+ NRAMP family transporter
MTLGMLALRAAGQKSAIVLTFEPFFFLAGFLLTIIDRFTRRTCAANVVSVARFVSLRLNS